MVLDLDLGYQFVVQTLVDRPRRVTFIWYHRESSLKFDKEKRECQKAKHEERFERVRQKAILK